MVNACWTLFGRVLAAGLVVAVLVAVYLYDHVDEQIRRHVQQRLAACYPGLKITVRSAERVEGRGILVRDVVVAEPGARGPAAQIVHIGEMFLVCRADLEELIGREPAVSQVVFRRPTFRATRRADGTWNTARLLPLPQFSDRPPALIVEDGTVEIVDAIGRDAEPLTLRHVNLALSPPGAAGGPGLAEGFRKVRGTCGGDDFGQLRLEGVLDPRQGKWNLAGSIDGLEVSPRSLQWLPRWCGTKLPMPRSLRGRAEIGFRLCDDAGPSRCRYELAGQFSQGEINDPRLAQPMTDIRATFRANNQGFAVDRLTAESGQSSLLMSCHGAGWGACGPLHLDAKVRRLEFDEHLAAALPKSAADAWQKFQPGGEVDADLTLDYDGHAWRPQVAIKCLDVAFSYDKFPYRLTQCTGSVVLKDGLLTADVTGRAGSQTVRVISRLSDPLGTPYGWVETVADGLPFDQKLYAAMDETTRAAIRAFDPQGSADYRARWWRDDPGSPAHRRLVASLNRIRVRYDRFPYPFTNVRGTIEMQDDHWTCRDVEGRNDDAVVTCSGGWVSGPKGGQLSLHFGGANVGLDDELRDALSGARMRRLWTDLRLEGVVDVDVEIGRRHAQERPAVVVVARPQGDKTSIQPASFPYRLENIQGLFRYADGQVTFERCRAEHGDSTATAAGYCRFAPDGGWTLQFDEFHAERLRADRDLIRAVPERLGRRLAALNLGGPLDLRGKLTFGRGPQPGAPLESRWELSLALDHGSLDAGVKLENICGKLRFTGGFDGRRMQSQGEMAVDSLTSQGIPFTELMGPFWIDDDKIVLGSGFSTQAHRLRPVGPESGVQLTTAHKSDPPRKITARVFGGTVFGHGSIEQSPQTGTPKWELQANLSECDLAHCNRQMLKRNQQLRGKMRATVDLWGVGCDVHAMGGRGRVELHDADIYELPVMISLLKILSIREPDRSAFIESNFDFTVEGPRVFFNPINFNGDAISLEGRGEMNLDKTVELTFRARLGRQQWNIPLVKNLLGGASEQIMLIHVAGTLDDPVTTKEPFPTVSQALQQLQGK